MKSKLCFGARLSVFVCVTVSMVAAQQSVTTVPNLINFSGVIKDANGRAITAVTGVTFLLYKNQQGGVPLWLETQNITPDRAGHYSVQLGASSAYGLPSDLFKSGEGRWLAVQFTNGPEQPRVMLLAVPYAMKAADADTVGGLPASAFALAAPMPSPHSSKLRRGPPTPKPEIVERGRHRAGLTPPKG